MDKTDRVSPRKGRFDLILIRRNDWSENREILRDYSLKKLVRISYTKNAPLQSCKPAISVN